MKNKMEMEHAQQECCACVSTFAQAPDDKKFVVSDGRLLKDLRQLADALEHMSDEVYFHHANSMRNDFSTWVESVLGEQELAEDLRHAGNQSGAQLAVLKYIARKAF